MTDVANPIIQVFEFARSWAEEHVTIFAPDLGQAESIYFERVETHHPNQPTEAEMAFPYFGSGFSVGPSLGQHAGLASPAWVNYCRLHP